MTEPIDSLKLAITQLAELLPRVTTLRIGLVFYRGEEIIEFPLTEIKQVSDDGGESLARMTKFISEIKVKQGLSNIEQATSQAISMLGTSTLDA